MSPCVRVWISCFSGVCVALLHCSLCINVYVCENRCTSQCMVNMWIYMYIYMGIFELRYFVFIVYFRVFRGLSAYISSILIFWMHCRFIFGGENGFLAVYEFHFCARHFAIYTVNVCRLFVVYVRCANI